MAKKTSIWSWLLIGVIILIGSYLRLAHLDDPSFWVDEMNHVVVAQSILEGKGPVLPSNEVYDRSIIFTKLVSFSFRLFGNNEFAARFPSALFGIFSIGLIIFIGSRLFENNVAITTGLLYAFNPFMIGWARECRMYSMFQCFFLISIYAVYELFDGTKQSQTKNPPKSRVQNLIVDWNLNLMWLPLVIVSFLIAVSLHLLSGVLFPSLIIYASSMIILFGIRNGWTNTLKSKYSFLVYASITIFFVIILIDSSLLAGITKSFLFAPNWATQESMQDPFRYVKFLSSSFFITLLIFSLLGIVAFFVKFHRQGFYLLVNFIVPLVLLSTLFTLRMERYIYHIYPLMLFIAAYGLVEASCLLQNQISKRIFVQSKTGPFKQLFTHAFLPAFISLVLIMSPWFRFSRKIPDITYGTNGAVSHLEWREAANFVKIRLSDNDPIISTLPLTVNYYAGNAEYYFLASLENPRPNEVYRSPSGLRDTYNNSLVVDTVNDIEKIVENNSIGWIIVDTYRLERQRYVRPKVVEYIKAHLKCLYKTPGGTVEVYGWG